MLADSVIGVLKRCSRWEPRVVIMQKLKYLTRYFLIGGPSSEGMETGDLTQWGIFRFRLPFGLYLHCFHRSDRPDAMHFHPWKWAYSLILKGGYYEDRAREGIASARTRKRYLPWSINRMTHLDAHRVDLIEGECWTLFLAGPLVDTWASRDPKTGQREVGVAASTRGAQ